VSDSPRESRLWEDSTPVLYDRISEELPVLVKEVFL
jgi:hypothetical protein